VDGYYNSLLSFIDNAVNEGFITPDARHIIVSAHTAQDLMCKLEVYIPTQTWIPRSRIFPRFLTVTNLNRLFKIRRFKLLTQFHTIKQVGQVGPPT
jgi:hypothetical protein